MQQKILNAVSKGKFGERVIYYFPRSMGKSYIFRKLNLMRKIGKIAV